MRSVEEVLGAADRDAVAAAVRRAEERTAGEIVPYVVAASDDYEEASWKGAALGAAAMALAAWLLDFLAGGWGGSLLLWSLLPVAVGFAAGFVGGRLPVLARALVDRETMERRTRERAETAFLEEEVFATRDRTGILLFVSLFEHRVVLLADSGITDRVDRKRWHHIVGRLTAAIAEGRTREGLVAAIERCGDVLVEQGIGHRPDDVDELDDELRVQDT